MALAIVVLLGGFFVLPRSATGGFTSAALAQEVPTPNLTELLNSPSPTPSSEPSHEPGDGDDGGSGGGSGGGSDDGDDGNSGPALSKGGDKNDAGNAGTKKDGRTTGDRGKQGKNKKDKDDLAGIDYSPPGGSFDTDGLVAAAANLRSLGYGTEQVMRKIYAPFIIGGPAGWSNTWGAPRYGPAPGQVRTHEGQDVFCNYGDPVLASQSGTIEFDGGGLGGKVARLHRDDGGYWYYAHLSEWNTKGFSSGDTVEAGDIIAYCGNSGNAITTPPHVHFGWYQGNGSAKNPQRSLVEWLHEAEKRVLGVVSKAEVRRVRQIDRLTIARRFGDAFYPDRTVVSGKELLAAAEAASVREFPAADSVLQVILSGNLAVAAGTAGDLEPTPAVAGFPAVDFVTGYSSNEHGHDHSSAEAAD